MKRRVLIALALAGAVPLGGCGINSIPTAEENAKAKWADVQAAYQRRADLIPNLSGDGERRGGFGGQDPDRRHQRARPGDLDPGQCRRPDRSRQGRGSSSRRRAQLGASLGRLLANVEAYPELKSQANFATFMSQIEGTENRINIAIQDYNGAVQAYNTRVRTFPDAIGAKIIYGAKPMTPFAATRRARKSRRRSISGTVADRHPSDAGASPCVAVLLFALLAARRWSRQRRRRPSRTLTGRVVDAAKLLTPEQVAQLDQLSAQRRAGIDAAVRRRDDPRPAGLSDRGLRLPARPRLEDRAGGSEQRHPPDRRAERAQGADRGRLWPGADHDRRAVAARSSTRRSCRKFRDGDMAGRHRRGRAGDRRADETAARGRRAARQGARRTQRARSRGRGDAAVGGFIVDLLDHGGAVHRAAVRGAAGPGQALSPRRARR